MNKYYKPQKTCTHCHRSKSFEEFNNNKSNKDGLSIWCKQCMNGLYTPRVAMWRLKLRSKILDLRQHVLNNINDDVVSEVI